MRWLTVKHDTAVTIGPSWSFWRLLAYKTIFSRDDVIGEFLFVENMTKFFIKLVVTIIRHNQFSVFYSKRVGKVVV
jgi:hypothetical protein